MHVCISYILYMWNQNALLYQEFLSNMDLFNENVFSVFWFLSSAMESLMWYKSKNHFACCCKSKCIVFIFRKDPHGFFAFPVTDAIAPGYSMIIKHPMDFGTMKEKIAANEYKSVTEFKVN